MWSAFRNEIMVAGRTAPGLVLRLPPNLNFALRPILRSRNNSVGDLLQEYGDSALKCATRATFGRIMCTVTANSSWVTSYPPSDFTMSARLSNWCASAVQLREIFASTADRRAEFPGLAASALYSAAQALHCSTESILGLRAEPPLALMS
jgi:hypothetical protein